MSPDKTKVIQGEFIEFISQDEWLCKSQNIKLISQTPKFNLGIISLSTILVLSSIKKYLSVHFQHLTFQCVRSKLFLYVGLHFLPFNLICNITTFRKKCVDLLILPHWSRVCVRTGYVLAWCSTLHSLLFDMQHGTVLSDFFLSFDP